MGANMQEPQPQQLKGLEQGDTVMFVTTTGATCPAILLTAPFQCLENVNQGWWGARLHVLNIHANGLSVPNANEIVPFSGTARTGYFHLSAKQQWMASMWNNQLEIMAANGDNMMPEDAAMSLTSMGGPIHGNALPDGIGNSMGNGMGAQAMAEEESPPGEMALATAGGDERGEMNDGAPGDSPP